MVFFPVINFGGGGRVESPPKLAGDLAAGKPGFDGTPAPKEPKNSPRNQTATAGPKAGNQKGLGPEPPGSKGTKAQKRSPRNQNSPRGTKKRPRGTKTEKHWFSKEKKGNPKKTINFQRKTKEIL